MHRFASSPSHRRFGGPSHPRQGPRCAHLGCVFPAPDSRLALLSLGFCGKCVTTATSQLIARMGALESLTLTGAYRLTDGCVAAICGARGAALRSLKISGNQQLTAAFVASIAGECDSLERLALEERTPPAAGRARAAALRSSAPPLSLVRTGPHLLARRGGGADRPAHAAAVPLLPRHAAALTPPRCSSGTPPRPFQEPSCRHASARLLLDACGRRRVGALPRGARLGRLHRPLGRRRRHRRRGARPAARGLPGALSEPFLNFLW